MSDPLSVAGTAVGIVSLGIQVCQGLINYIQAAKGRKDEIQDSIQDVQQVVLLIYSLNNTLRGINGRRYTESLAASLKRCYASLEKLQAFLVKLDPPQQSTGTLRISTIAGILVGIGDQQHETQWLIRDFGQMVDGRLTVIETGLGSIAHNNGVTAARIEEITQTLASHSESLSNMGCARTGPIAQQQATNPLALGSLISDEPGIGMSLSSRCNLQDQHHRGCVLFDIQRNKKRKALARFPYKVAWFSARMALACVEYTTGTSKLGIFVPYKNVVHSDHSPVIQIFGGIWDWDIESRPATRIIQDIESIERQVLSMYRDGTSSPNDRDEDNMNHAEVFFYSLIEINCGCTLLDRMIEDDRVLVAVLRVFRTLLLISDDSDGTLFCQILYEKIRDRLSDPVQSFIRASDDISPLHKAILLQSLNDLVAYVTQEPKSLTELLLMTRDNWTVPSYTDSYTVLHLATTWPDGLRYLLSTKAKRFLDDSLSPNCYRPPFILATYRNCIESVYILMEAGCSFELSRRTGEAFAKISTVFMATLAFDLAKKRLQLLKMAQRKLGKFLEGTTVAFADMKAAEICDYLDRASIPFHRSLRVERDYRSIYSCAAVPVHSFYLFWEHGFHHIKSYDNLGLLPAMTYRYWMFKPPCDLEIQTFLKAIYWLHEKGFLNHTPTDPLKLGLNLSSTAYHYIGAMFGAFYDAGESQEPQQLPDAWLVIKSLSSIKVEDECVCWCNATDHGCSPIKLLLKSHLDERQPGIRMDFGLLRHIVFHHRIFDASLSSSAKKPTGFVIELLRLLTFEALEMTHTSCTFDAISEDILEGMVSTASVRPAAIFLCRGKKVRDIRSSPGEKSSSRLLEDLMSEFTTRLTQHGQGPEAFEHFIKGYWRRRISELYDPDPQVMNEMKQHQAFRGFKASAGVEEYILPKRLLRLLGEDFELVGVDSRAEESASLFETESSSDTESPSDTESLSDKESSSEIVLFCEYCHMSDTDSDDDQSDDQSDEEMICESCCGKEGELDVDEDCDWETCSSDTGEEYE
ncbi:hypothetical protein HG530_013156 [Fusarium avenaceum]|nr:hypothetical protein HG530_013156 [Fusarium avenaceum]